MFFWQNSLELGNWHFLRWHETKMTKSLKFKIIKKLQRTEESCTCVCGKACEDVYHYVLEQFPDTIKCFIFNVCSLLILVNYETYKFFLFMISSLPTRYVPEIFTWLRIEVFLASEFNVPRIVHLSENIDQTKKRLKKLCC